MRRRAFIAGTAVLAAGTGCLDGGGRDPNGESNDPDEPPFEVTTVDGPGSEAGTVTVPTGGQVQLVNFIRTTCPTSRRMLTYVGEARDRLAETHDVGPEGTIHVVTVVNGSDWPRSPAELGEWWAEQGGHWTVGIDESGSLFTHYDVTGTPTMIAVDGAGEVHWRDKGGTTTNRLVNGVERALEAADGVEPESESTSGNETESASEDDR